MSWPTVPFTEVLKDVTGGNTKTLQSDYEEVGQYPIIDQGQEMIGGYSDDISCLCQTKPPVIIFGDHTKTLKFVDFPFCLGADGTKVLEAKDGADPKYLFYALHDIHIPEAGYSRHFKYLKAGLIPLPPLEEQKRIAGILDQADALRRLRTRALEKLNTLGQAIFHEMFGVDLKEAKKQSLSELIEVRSSLADPRTQENSILPHVGPEHIASGSGRIDWKNVRTCGEDGVISGKYRFEDGDVIFSKIRPNLNKVAIADQIGMCSADMYALHAPNGEITERTLHFILGSSKFLAYASTVSNRANIPKMNRSQLLAFETVVPEIQKQIEFQGKLDLIEFQRVAASALSSKSEALFASLQHRAFRGEL